MSRGYPGRQLRFTCRENACRTATFAPKITRLGYSEALPVDARLFTALPRPGHASGWLRMACGRM
eukprot:1825840-Pleurochrysis_carterae.AAC.1